MSIEMNANSLPLHPGAEPMTVLAGQPRNNSLANKRYRVAGNQNGRGDDGESRSAVERWGVEGSDAAGGHACKAHRVASAAEADGVLASESGLAEGQSLSSAMTAVTN